MKKTVVSTLLAAATAASLLAGCGSSSSSDTAATEAAAASTEASAEAAASTTEAAASSTEAAGELKDIDVLNVAFVPSRDPDEIVTQTEPLKQLLQDQLKTLGYNVKDVEITVGTSYEAVGEGLEAGTIDVGFIPGGTYVLYDDGCEALLTATRSGLSIDSDDPKVWNDNKPTTASDQQVTYYRALMIAGPSDAGKAVADKVNSGEDLTWDDFDSLNWGVMGPTSSAGYIYPALWMKDKFGKTITDLSHAVQCDSYGTAFARLAQGQIDALCVYADGRRDYEDKWTSDYAMTNSIWDDTNVIGVTEPIYNDTISVSKNSEVMQDADFKSALQQAFINIGNSDEGKQVIAIYSHEGYEPAQDSNYDGERQAQELLNSLGATN
ncbi:MAG: phosphate/phosphite/phosphonate ABC transporter substrate-binding protein [Lachnospiraceae bacterium]|jgi:phosphonate transport system substrate-binding protein|nr:phosphate/phosphite/phosphonate ABC transporter substrate-binding protein [Lachnospiraceae bacterium]MCI1398724.1 phosphate/phosphite/phosphonate ABC transporter substrate-binding protein [Lachnospiraceae bacterium]MCI1424814.1 phosphate/phosphite/phosphonate ABC transporter substrate-binding protein [Lachnospiraceae bacterium]MCI1453509.1 phosphate/phosphite/phosphonate ABC transporter substrate-binding protein [Lachnospiraceae bacterium]MDD5850064.1 phosphate/phosphite/phosphonate ABC tran